MSIGGAGNDDSGSGNTPAPTMNDIFDNISPEEITLIAAVFSIAIASDLSDNNATSLAFFFSTVGSNIGLYIDRRGRERLPQVPGLG